MNTDDMILLARIGAAHGVKGEVRVKAGDTLIFETPGGGGFGKPALRDQRHVARDIADGLVSREAAEREYGYGGKVDDA